MLRFRRTYPAEARALMDGQKVKRNVAARMGRMHRDAALERMGHGTTVTNGSH